MTHVCAWHTSDCTYLLFSAHSVCEDRLRGDLQNQRHIWGQGQEEGQEEEGSRSSGQCGQETSTGETSISNVQMLRNCWTIKRT